MHQEYERDSIDLMIDEEIKELALKEIEGDEPLTLEGFEGGTITLVSPGTCRWCGHVGAPGDTACSKCGCWFDAAWEFTTGEQKTRFLHNPDGSMFIEFVQPGGKTARYTLSQETLMKAGALQFFDQDPEGRRE